MKKGQMVVTAAMVASLLGGCGLMTREGTPSETESGQNIASESGKYPSEHHKKAHKSLSPKNQKAYETLAPCDQDRVVNSYKKGRNHQKTLNQILKEDQYDNTPTKDSRQHDSHRG